MINLLVDLMILIFNFWLYHQITTNEYDPIILEEKDNENNNNDVNKENQHFIKKYPSKNQKFFFPKFLYFALDINKQNKILEKNVENIWII